MGDDIPAGLTPVAQALEHVVSNSKQLRRESGTTFESWGASSVPLAQALGRVIAERVEARWDVPSTKVSIKDGYAIRSDDCTNADASNFPDLWDTATGSSLLFRVVGDAMAGGEPHEKGEWQDQDAQVPPPAWYVTTGSPLPPDFDTVVEVEKSAELRNGRIVAFSGTPGSGFPAGLDVRQPGSDIKQGAAVAEPGDSVDSTAMGLLAMIGRGSVVCFRSPKVGVLSSGDELVDVSHEQARDTASVQQGQRIFDANRPMLLAMLGEATNGGCEPIDLGIVRDQPADLTARDESWLENALESDLDALITSGGVSMGRRDFIRSTLERRGDVLVERLFMKPGKPIMVVSVPRKQPNRRPLLVFSLPGNPVSSTVTFSLLVAPALRSLAGWNEPLPARIVCTLAHDVRLDPVRPEFHRARLSYSPSGSVGLAPLASSTGFQRSSALTSMRGADVLLELPNAKAHGSAFIRKGSLVRAVVIGDLRRQSHLVEENVHQVLAKLESSIASQEPSNAPFQVEVVAQVEILSLVDEAKSSSALSSPVSSVLRSIRGIEVCGQRSRVRKSEILPMLHRYVTDAESASQRKIIVIDNYCASDYQVADAFRDAGFLRVDGLEEVSRSIAAPLGEDLVATTAGATCFFLAFDLSALKSTSDQAKALANKFLAVLPTISAAAP